MDSIEESDALVSSAELRTILASGNVVVITGSGVSSASASLPSWHGLLRNGIERIRQRGLCDEATARSLFGSLETALSSEDLVAVASSVRKHFTGPDGELGEFAAWLRTVFDLDKSSIGNSSLLRAVWNLGGRIYATTNYDKTLALANGHTDSITWRQSSLLPTVLQGRIRMVHLHGVWDDPESVILGREDYSILLESEQYQSFLRSIWLSHTVVFIGCSLDGMRDPDLGRLLDWFREHFGDSPHNHFALFRKGTYSAEQAREFLLKWRIKLVPYGTAYTDLLPYLHSITPVTQSPLPPPPFAFVGREAQCQQIIETVRSGGTVLVHGMGGIGKTSLASRVITSMVDARLLDYAIWIDTGLKSEEEVFRLIAAQLRIGDPGWSLSQIKKAISEHASEGPLLIVLDDASDHRIARRIVAFFASSKIAAVVTSRLRFTGASVVISLEGLIEEESVSLFHALAGSHHDRDAISALCNLVENHPLSVSLLASRVATEDVPIDALLRRIRDKKEILSAVDGATNSDDREISVRASVLVSLENLDARLLDILTVLSFCSHSITAAFLGHCLEITEDQCEDRAGQLIVRSLVRRRLNSFDVHPIICSVVQTLDEKYLANFDTRTLLGLARYLTNVELNNINSQRNTVADTAQILLLIGQHRLAQNQLHRMVTLGWLSTLGGDQGLMNRFSLEAVYAKQIIRATDSAMSYREIQLDHALSIQIQQIRAHAYASVSQYQIAASLLDEILKFTESNPIEPSMKASLLLQKGNVLLEQFQYHDAEMTFKIGLSIIALSDQPILVAALTGQLGQIKLVTGDLNEARSLYEKAKSIYASNDHDSGIAACEHNLGDIAVREGDSLAGWSLNVSSFQRDLAAGNIAGALTSIDRLADMAIDDSRLTQFLALLTEAERAIPVETINAHIGALESIKAMAFHAAGMSDVAKSLLEECIRIREISKDTRGLAVCLGRLANVYLSEGQKFNFLSLNEKSWQAYISVSDSEGAMKCAYNQSSVLLSSNSVEDAKVWICKAIEIAALDADYNSTMHACDLLIRQILPRLSPVVEPSNFEGPFTYNGILIRIAHAAHNQDLDTLISSAILLRHHFSAGGGSNDQI